MPYKKGSLKGQLTTAEIRKLIRAHNVLIKKSLIKIPAGTSRDQLLKLIDKAGLSLVHNQKKLEPVYDNGIYDHITLDATDDILKKPSRSDAETLELLRKKKLRDAKKLAEMEKTIKLAKKEGVKEFKQKKAEAKKKPVQKPAPKPVEKPKKKTQTILKKKGNDKDKGEAVKKPVQKKQEPVSDDSRKEIIDDWGSDANNVMIEQNHKKLKDGIVSLWDSNKKFINIDGLFQFDKKLFNELFMKYPAQKVIDGLKKFMLYATDSDDEGRIGQSEFKNWFEIRDGRIQSQIRGKDLNSSTLNKMIKEWDETFGKKKEVKKEVKKPVQKEVKKEVKKEEKVNDKLKPLLEKLENPEQYLKPVKARQETLYAVSSILLDKNISFKDFKDIIESMSIYDDEFGVGFAFSFNKGQAPPKWRKKLSILIRKGIKAISLDSNPDDIKNVWTEWTKLLPKSVKTEPSEKDEGKVQEKIKKQFDESKKLIKQFETENKGIEKKDFSKLKKRYDYEQMINYKLFIKGANMMLRLSRKNVPLSDDMKKKVQEENQYNGNLKDKIDKIYKDRK